MTLHATIQSDEGYDFTVTGEAERGELFITTDNLTTLERARVERALWARFVELRENRATVFRDPLAEFYDNDK